MKKIFIQIVSLFFIIILLTSNILNLHIFLDQNEDEHCHMDSSHNHDDGHKDDPCKLCLLVLNLNNLDYYNPIEFSFEDDASIFGHNRKEVLIYQELKHDQLALLCNKNKAPPYYI